MPSNHEDHCYDAERLALRESRMRLAAERGETLTKIEDDLASVNGSSAVDRRLARERLLESRARLAW